MHKVPRVGLCLMSAHESCVIAKDSKKKYSSIGNQFKQNTSTNGILCSYTKKQRKLSVV